MEGSVCDYLDMLSNFIMTGKPTFFDNLSTQEQDTWKWLLDTNNWTDDFFSYDELRQYKDQDGKHLRGCYMEDGEMVFIPLDKATNAELRWYITRQYLRPAIMKANKLLAMGDNNSYKARLLDMTVGWVS